MDPILGPIIGGAISGISSLFGGNASSRAAQNNAALNVNMQQMFAQHGLEWKAKDARAAEADTGINALALLGVPTSSFSTVAGDTDAGQGIRGAGQDIGRAVAAASSINERQQELDARLVQAKIDNVNADTVRMLAASSGAARVYAPGTPPPVPLPPVDMRRVGAAYWAKPTSQDYVGPHGGLISAPTADLSQSFQNWGSMPAQVAYAAQNIYENLGHALGDASPGWQPGVSILDLPLRRDAWRGVDMSQYVPF